MKKTVFSCLLLLTGLAGRADERSDALLKNLADRFRGYASYRVDFTVSIPGEMDEVAGSLLAKGPKFRLELKDYEVYSDGKYQYTYSSHYNEVTVEPAGETGADFLTNPARAFFLYDREVNSVYAGRSGEWDIVEVAPKKAGTNFRKLRLYLDGRTGDPGRIGITSADGLEAVVRIVRITPEASAPDSRFAFDRERHPGAEVIDFR